jgi:hypothetical protein
MRIKKVSKILEGSILDEMRDEQDRKDKERQKRNAEIDKRQGEEIKAHKSTFVQPAEIPDFNPEKTKLMDKIGEIILHSLQSGDESPKEELEKFISKHSQYLKYKHLR